MKQHSYIHLLSALAISAGIALTAQSAPVYGALSGQGTTVYDRAAETVSELRPAGASFLAAERAEAGVQLMFGMLLILLGGFLYAFQRARDERPVHITAMPSSRKRIAWFWMELRL